MINAARSARRAVIGSSLNSGAIELYTQRMTFRPEGWSEAELDAFLRMALRTHAGVYLLEDSAGMGRVVDGLRSRFRVVGASVALDVPLFGDGPVAHVGALWRIED